jgi:acyl-CoA synthetase (AMP-forming)/AMP-acid ligase II
MTADIRRGWTSDPTATTLLPEHVHAMAVAYGNREAVVNDDEVLSYREIEEQSAALARGLLARGVGKGMRIGLLLSNGPRFVVWWAALVRIGAVATPLSTFSRPGELARGIRHADLHGVIFQRSHLRHDFVADFEAAFPALSSSSADLAISAAPYLRWMVLLDADGVPPWAHDSSWILGTGVPAAVLGAAEQEVHVDDPAMIVLTSGQSAAPKGVMHTQGVIAAKIHYLRAMLEYTADTPLVANMPFFWVGGLVMSLLTGMEIGARITCMDASSFRLSAPLGSTVAGEHGTSGVLSYARIPALGMTETFGMYSWGNVAKVTGYPLAAPLDEIEPGYDIAILDEDDKPVPDGEAGQIAVRGASVTRQILKVARADSFTVDGFFRTGDRGVRNGRRVHFLGRLGDMIKTSGANVAPPEVEQELIALGGIAIAAVFGVPHDERGEMVIAAVAASPGVTLDPEDLKPRLRGRLSAYKVPRHFMIMSQEDMPLTPSQKVDRKALRTMFASRNVTG